MEQLLVIHGNNWHADVEFDMCFHFHFGTAQLVDNRPLFPMATCSETLETQTVMNTGTIITEAALTDAVGDDVIWNVLENSRTYMEKNFGKVAKPQPPPKKGMLSGLMGGGNKKPQPMVGTPPAAPAHVKARAAFMVHGAPKLSYEVSQRSVRIT